MIEPNFSTITLREQRLRAATWGSGPPDIVMLHDGLGSIGQWRDVPERVAHQTGQTVLAYERCGHGESLPTPAGPWPTDWLHREAATLDAVLDAVGATTPILVGHSDGGTVALLYAAGKTCRARAVLSLAAHSWVEQICFDSIVGMRAERQRIIYGLARYHAGAEALFEAWSGVWVSEAFRSWDIRPELAQITIPTLVAQGSDDEYASQEHAHLTAAAVGATGESLIVAGLGHIMHHDDAGAVVALIADFAAAHVPPVR